MSLGTTRRRNAEIHDFTWWFIRVKTLWRTTFKLQIPIPCVSYAHPIKDLTHCRHPDKNYAMWHATVPCIRWRVIFGTCITTRCELAGLTSVGENFYSRYCWCKWRECNSRRCYTSLVTTSHYMTRTLRRRGGRWRRTVNAVNIVIATIPLWFLRLSGNDIQHPFVPSCSVYFVVGQKFVCVLNCKWADDKLSIHSSIYRPALSKYSRLRYLRWKLRKTKSPYELSNDKTAVCKKAYKILHSTDIRGKYTTLYNSPNHRIYVKRFWI